MALDIQDTKLQFFDRRNEMNILFAYYAANRDNILRRICLRRFIAGNPCVFACQFIMGLLVD